MKLACFPLLLAIAFASSRPGLSFDVPSVGYLNISLQPGFNLISAPLRTLESDIAGMFGSQNNLPDGLKIYVMEDGEFHGTTYVASTGQFEPAVIAMEKIPPGRAFFVYNPMQTEVLLTFAGEILQGELTNFLPAGFSAVAPMIPRNGTLTAQGFPAEPGDIVYFWNATTQMFRSSTFDDIDGGWLPREEAISAGEGFILFKHRAVNWTIDFALEN